MKWIADKINSQYSLFYTLFGSFIAIILLLVSFNTLSHTYFRNNIKDELIVNSGLNLRTTVTNYEKHIKLIRSFMLGYLFSNDTQLLKSGNPSTDYEIAWKAQQELQHTLNNSLLYLDNIMYYFNSDDLIIDKDGTRDSVTMFSKFYAHPDYSADFWQQELQSAESFKMYPSAVFRINTLFEQKSLGELMPILIKSTYDPSLAFIALMKSSAAYESFHQPKAGGSFAMLDESRNLLFASTPGLELPESVKLQTGSGYEKIGNTYYFYRTGTETGFFYVEVFSDSRLNEQIRKLNKIMLAFLALSLFIGLAVSYLISRKFHNPLAHMLRSIQTLNKADASGGMHSRIREFNILHSKLKDLSRTNQEFHEDLKTKNNLLQQFAYMTRLKKISVKGAQLPALIEADKPYQFVLFRVDFKDRFFAEISNSPQRALIMYEELIHSHFTSHYHDSLTFQLEKDQILTILFIGPEGEEERRSALDSIVSILSIDASYCNFTIALSPDHLHSADFAEAYQNTLDLAKQRRLGEDVQIITEWLPQPALTIPSPLQESELMANLQSGAVEVTVPLVDKLLEQLERSGALAWQFQEFAKEIVGKTLKVMYIQNIQSSKWTDVKRLYDRLKACHTMAQYKAFMRDFLTESADAIQEKKSGTDVMTKFVMEYVESNYGDDLSLDAIAGKLGITGPYLSTYFKEKTGINFSDYIFTVRMNKAMDMLRDTDLKIQEIASLVGYYTVASFNRVFKRHTGMTPSEFRRQHRPE